MDQAIAASTGTDNHPCELGMDLWAMLKGHCRGV